MLEKIINYFAQNKSDNPWNPQPAYKEDIRDSEFIEFMDAFGRVYQINRKEYRTNVLPKNFTDNWNSTEKLVDLIIGSIRDGFIIEAEPASLRLLHIDYNTERAVCIRNHILVQLNRLSDAEEVICDFLKKHPKTGLALTGYAKTLYAKNKKKKSLKILEEGLKLDPNQENGLDWWLSMQIEGFKKNNIEPTEAYMKALESADNMFHGWRIKLLLGKLYAESKNKDMTIKYFDQVLTDKWDPYVLFEISGSLGKAGFIIDLINMVAPLYIPEEHEVYIGINLLQAYLEMKRVDEGVNLLNKLFSLNRPDIQEKLFWYESQFHELQRVKFHYNEQYLIGWDVIDLPLWCYGWNEKKTGFDKNRSEKKIAIFQFAWENEEGQAQSINEFAVQNLSLVIPLYLLEGIYFTNEAKASFLFTNSNAGSFVAFSDGELQNKMASLIKDGYAGVLTAKMSRRKLIINYFNLAENIKQSCILKLDIENPEECIMQIQKFVHSEANISCEISEEYYNVGFGKFSNDGLKLYLYVLVRHLSLYKLLLNNETTARLNGERGMIRASIDLALYNMQTQAKLTFLCILQMFMNCSSTVLLDFSNPISALLREIIDKPSAITELAIETYINFGDYCKKTQNIKKLN